MMKLLDKGKVIGMKLAGVSNREIHRTCGYDRVKISQVWSEYNASLAKMNAPNADIKAIQEEMYAEPKYDTSKRTKRKYTHVVETALKEILEQEEVKTRRLGPRHKQKLTNKQIYEQLVELGHDIGRVTINNAIARLRKKLKEVYIRQHYDFGERLEYDFGEVLLDCGKGIRKYHMAIFSSPASNFKWAYAIRQARHLKQDYAAFLEDLLTQESERRAGNGITRRIKEARFPIKKYLVDFDKRKYDPQFTPKFEELETLDFIDNKENIILIGTPGAGKTPLCNSVRDICVHARKERFVCECS